VKGARKKVNSRVAKVVELGRLNLERIRRKHLLALGVSRNRKMPNWPFSGGKKQAKTPYLHLENDCIYLINKELFWFRQMTFLSYASD
jgi:hypothetical protein